MSNTSSSSSQVITLPQGGGALRGIGETFAPDLHTGTGNFSVPLELPPGRNGFQPQISLLYSTGNGNGPFGLGWSLSIPGVTRKTSKGVPRYDDAHDTFILSGAEDLVPVSAPAPATLRYRPRTEGLFAHIDHHREPGDDHWEVRTKDGLVSFYGTPGAAGRDPAVIADPAKPTRICTWLLTETLDPFGNRIVYEYVPDDRPDGRPYLERIRYVDFGDDIDQDQFLVSIVFTYGDPPAERPDAFSDRRAGFEVRTRLRCQTIEVRTHAGEDRLVRTYQLTYRNDTPNGVSLLTRLEVSGRDGDQVQSLPPLTFAYTTFDPQGRDFFALEGRELPASSLASPDLELADLFGNGLPNILQMNGAVRYWRNLGDGRFDIPRPMRDAPAGVALADPEVQLLDASGDGRIDLLVQQNGLSGYFPLRFDGEWDRRSFQRQQVAPSFSFADPEVQLVDLDGDGVTDAVRSGARLECFFNDPKTGWHHIERRAIQDLPAISFSDPRVRWADVTGDGLQDLVVLYDGNIEYWPSVGHGEFGHRTRMQHSPRLPFGYDPARILLGDVDGDGLADIVYVDDGKVFLWLNQSGNGWSDPVEIDGTPPLANADAVRLVDVLGSGVPGVLWSKDATLPGRDHYFFLDFTGGVKPYLLNEMDNHVGAVTRVDYKSSTHFYLLDAQKPTTRWQTPLPFPVFIVARVEAIDQISRGKLTTEYRYHHGYWDGAEREFRGFGMVEQQDTETFEGYKAAGLHGEDAAFEAVDERRFSPPVLTKNWFHQGPVGDEFGAWTEIKYEDYWEDDEPVLDGLRPELDGILAANDSTIPRRIKRDALRALRGSVLRTELYACDGTGDRQRRPYTVTETQYDVGEVPPEGAGDGSEAPKPEGADDERPRVFFPRLVAQRTTRWERGVDPMTSFTFTGDHDRYGQPRAQTVLAVPRGRNFRVEHLQAGEPYLGTHVKTTYAQRNDDEIFIVDRPASTTQFEIINNGSQALLDLFRDVRANTVELKPLSQTINHYDGEAFEGLPPGQIGSVGALVRSERLVLTTALLEEAYRATADDPAAIPPYLAPNGEPPWTDDYPLSYRSVFATRPLAGYVFHDGDSADDSAGFRRLPGYFVNTSRTKYDVHDDPAGGRGLPLALLDPLGNQTTIDHYAFDLLPTAATDAAGLTMRAVYDCRVLGPRLVTDPNGNQTEFRFTPLGLLRETRVMGKENESVGDRNGSASSRFEYDLGSYREFRLAPAHQADLDRGATSAELASALAANGLALSSDASVAVLRPGQAWRLTTGQRSYLITSSDQHLLLRGQPVSVRTIRREHHTNDTDVPPPALDTTLETIEYSDGFGRLVQTRTQAEDLLFGDVDLDAPLFGSEVVPADQDDTARTLAPVVGHRRGEDDPANVAVSGWQIYDNKGHVVEKFEPFFSSGFDYLSPKDERALFDRNILGQQVSTFYDPRGQVFRTVNPDGSELRIIFGVPLDLADPDVFEPTPWEAFTYDANDNAARTHPADPLTALYPHHYDTPSSIVVDALGRTVLAVERNRAAPARPDDELPPLQELKTRYVYDIRGNLLAVLDALDRPAFRYAYDLANNPLHTDSLDAGIRRAILDAAGNEVERRDRKGALVLRAYDALNRPTHLWARDDAATTTPTLRQRLIYGDSPEVGVPDVAARNLLGRLHKHYDEAGLVTCEGYDFKGNLLEKTRRVVSDDAIASVFKGIPNPPEGWRVPAFRVAWERQDATTMGELEEELLDEFQYRTSMSYDALNRVKTMSYPQDVIGERKVLRPRYNRAGALESVRVAEQRADPEGTLYVGHIAYNAKGQRSLIAASNGVMIRYAYDPQTFRLVRLRSERYTQPDSVTYQPAGGLLQDFAYGYDLVGNVLAIHDRTPDSGVPPQSGRLDRALEYDAIYRLISARGREHAPDGHAPPWEDQPKPQDITRTQRYSEAYQYDSVGNMKRLRHAAHNSGNTGGFTRNLEVADGTNQVHMLTVGNGANPLQVDYAYDDNGNLVSETSSRHFEWDHSDQMRVFRTQSGNAEPSVHAHYLYDAAGMRVKKLVRKQGGSFEATAYIDGIFEHHRWAGSGHASEQNSHLHVMDGEQRITLVRVGAPHPDDQGPAVQFHLVDHLGSSTLVVSQEGNFINREEYTPYGETSFGAFAKKRYRFVGKECDEETGLYYIGARYYSPWLGRWTTPDPDSGAGGSNVYIYANNNPTRYRDPTGRQAQTSETSSASSRLRDLSRRLAQGMAKAWINNLDLPSPQAEKLVRELTAETHMEELRGSEQAFVDATAAAFRLTTGLLGASWGEESVSETIEGLANLPNNIRTTISNWNKLTPYERYYRLTMAGLIVRGGFRTLSRIPGRSFSAKITEGGGLKTSNAPGAAEGVASEGALPESPAPTPLSTGIRATVRTTISAQKQARHVIGTPQYKGGSYFKSAGDAQAVLDAFHSGKVEVMGMTRAGHIQVRFNEVTGFNNNPGAGFINQPTNMFVIKGTSSPSVVPISPLGVLR